MDNYDDKDFKENEDEIMPQTRLGRNHRKQGFWHYFGRFLSWCFLVLGLLFVSGVGVFAYYAKSAPTVTTTKLQAGGSSALYTNDGKFLLSLGSDKRNYIRSDQIPQQLKDAVLSIEDKRFYNEPLGVDPIRIAGSLVANIKGHDISAGGSGITQQLIKLSVFSTDASQRNIRRKAQEAWLAMQITQKYSKEKILEYYINKPYMGYNNYGIGTASNYYYGKHINQLDLSQTAMLAGMLNSPTSYDPYLYPEATKNRRDTVLYAMYRNNKIDKQTMNRAMAEPINYGLRPRHTNNDHSQRRIIDDPYIKEVVNEAKAKGFDPYNSNLKITVNIDQKAQNELYELANSNKVPFTNEKMQVGATVVDPSNGHVVAIIGGRNLPKVALGYNRAVQTGRSTGSSIKPILDYAPAIEYKNWSTAEILYDTPYVYSGTNVQLYDWDNTYQGAMTMRYALEQSRNVPAVRTLQTVGLQKASKFAKQMGINIEKSQGLSVGIGANASTLQMAGAYGALANQGVYHAPHFISKIETPDGLEHLYDNAGERVMKTSTAYMITDMLKGVISKGSGTKAQIPRLYQAGKTGTVKYSDSELKKFPSYAGTPKDSWFVGYTKDYSIAVWTGYDNLRDGKISGNGENSAQLFYKSAMQYLMKDKVNSDWQKPDTVVAQKLVSGRAITNELYVKGHTPKPPKIPKKKKNDARRIIMGRNQDNQNEQRTQSQQGTLQKHYIVRRDAYGNLHYYYYYTR